MIAQHIYQWNTHYPSHNAFARDIKRGELFVIEQNNQLIATIVLSTFIDAEYKQIDWLTPPETKNLYIHRLAVHPDFQGQGYAQKLMHFAETHAKENDFDSIRLDTFSQNPRNLKFYEQRGYVRLESIYFPKQSEHPFYCYELLIKK